MRRIRGDRGRTIGHELGVAALDEAGGGVRRRQLAGIFAAGAKGEMGARRLMQRTQIVDLFLAVAEMEEFGAGRFGDQPSGDRAPRAGKNPGAA